MDLFDRLDNFRKDVVAKIEAETNPAEDATNEEKENGVEGEEKTPLQSNNKKDEKTKTGADEALQLDSLSKEVRERVYEERKKFEIKKDNIDIICQCFMNLSLYLHVHTMLFQSKKQKEQVKKRLKQLAYNVRNINLAAS